MTPKCVWQFFVSRGGIVIFEKRKDGHVDKVKLLIEAQMRPDGDCLTPPTSLQAI